MRTKLLSAPLRTINLRSIYVFSPLCTLFSSKELLTNESRTLIEGGNLIQSPALMRFHSVLCCLVWKMGSQPHKSKGFKLSLLKMTLKTDHFKTDTSKRAGKTESNMQITPNCKTFPDKLCIKCALDQNWCIPISTASIWMFDSCGF